MKEKIFNGGTKEMEKIYEPSKYEDEIYKKWEESGFFNPDNLKLPKDAKSYSIVMPPPNVTGTLHMGHAAMLALEDILIRYHRMKGKDKEGGGRERAERVLWIPGTDHASIATQTKVEKIIKEEGTDRHKLGREKFLERVRKFAQESHDTINNQCKKMGSSCDWSREAYTLDENRSKAVRSVFKMMYDDGLIYRGDRVVNWCPRCNSTLADDEVEYKEQKAKFYTFRYAKDFPIAISTTRPETKLGDTAVAVNPKDKRYKKYIGQTFEINFVGVPLHIKVIASHEVDMSFGTGALGVTPAHSMVDWQMAQENDLRIVKVIDEQGNIHHGFGEYSGRTVKEARKLVVENLKKEGLIEKEEEIDNNLSLCYRCDTPIEPLPSLQWFISVNTKIKKYGKSLKELAIEAVKKGVFGKEKINIIPERFEKNYFHWMENLHDWCISRQIWFGHQIPVWYNNAPLIKGDACPSSLRRDDSGRGGIENVEIYVGVEAPEGDAPASAEATADEWVQDPDTLDTWFSSGLWTFSTLASNPEQIKIKDGKLFIDSKDFDNFHPTAVLETGYDILFFWVARMIIMTTYAIGDIPFQDVYLHGLVRDDKGRKMSKSLGNVIDPLDMIAKFGTDATRLSLVAGNTPGNDMNLSEEKIAGFRNLINKIWNIFRYIIANYELKLEGYEPEQKNLTKADEWILEKTEKLVIGVSEDLDNYRFSQAAEKLREFTCDDLADWYLEASKFEKTSKSEKEKILSIVLNDLLKLWYPFIPFITEVLWNELGYPDTKNESGGKTGMLMESALWPNKEYYKNKKYLKTKTTGIIDGKDFDLIIDIIKAIRNARAENKVEPAKKIKAVIYAGRKTDLIKSQEVLIKSLRTGIEELEIKKSGEKINDAIPVVVGEIEIYLLGAKDEAKEKERIKKEIENLEKMIKAGEAKLKNKEFVKNAPKKIVDEEKEKLKQRKEELKKLKKS